MVDNNDPVEELRRRHGIDDADQRPRAGVVGSSSQEQRAEAYRKEMKKLWDGGADYGGHEQFRRFMRRAGR